MKIIKLLEMKESNLKEFEQALSDLLGNDLEDDEVFSKKPPDTDDPKLDFIEHFGSGKYSFSMYCKGGELTGFGPRELFFFNNDDEYIGHARLTKSDKMVSINMIAFIEEHRGWGYGKQVYKYFLDDLKLDIKSDSEITQGTYGMYMSLAKEYEVGVDTNDGRAIIYHK